MKVLPVDSSLNGSFPHRVLVLVFPIKRQANFQFFFCLFDIHETVFSFLFFFYELLEGIFYVYATIRFVHPVFSHHYHFKRPLNLFFFVVVVVWEVERLPLKRRP